MIVTPSNWNEIFPLGVAVRVAYRLGETAIVTGHDHRDDGRTTIRTTAGTLLASECGSTVATGCDGINSYGGYTNMMGQHLPYAEKRCGVAGDWAHTRRVGHLILCDHCAANRRH